MWCTAGASSAGQSSKTSSQRCEGEHQSSNFQLLTIIMFFRNNCTYCGGDLEDNYPPAALCLAVVLFPVGILGCLLLKERQCVLCNRTSSAWIFTEYSTNSIYFCAPLSKDIILCSVMQKFYDYLHGGLPLCNNVDYISIPVSQWLLFYLFANLSLFKEP